MLQLTNDSNTLDKVYVNEVSSNLHHADVYWVNSGVEGFHKLSSDGHNLYLVDNCSTYNMQPIF